MDGARADPAEQLKQKRREPRHRIIASSENPHVSPRIEIMLNRQEENAVVSAPAAKLHAIGVLFPTDTPQQFPVGGMERDEVAATAMVRPEDKLLRAQLRKSPLDIARPKPRAIPPDGHNFVITKLRDSFDRVLKARRETSPGLAVNAGASDARASCGREQMDINRTRSFRGKGGAEKWPRCIRQRTARQVDVQFVGEYEYGSTGHRPWIREREGERQAFFVERFALRTARLSRFGKIISPVPPFRNKAPPPRSGTL